MKLSKYVLIPGVTLFKLRDGEVVTFIRLDPFGPDDRDVVGVRRTGGRR